MSSLLSDLPSDQIRLLLCVFINFPLGLLNNHIHNKTARLIYGLVIGLVVQTYMYQAAIINIYICSIVNLMIIKLLDRRRVGLYVTLYTFSHLSAVNIYRIIYDYAGWNMDVSTIMMMTLCKYCSFAYCYSDGGKENTSISSHNKKYIIEDFSVLEYFSYIHFYSSCIMGPFFEFADFKDYIFERNDYTSIPNTFIPGIKRLGLGLFFGGLHVLTTDIISIKVVLGDGNMLYRIFIYFLLLLQKFKFYCGFLFAESVCVACGLAYKKETGSKFDKIKNADILIVETSTSISKTFQHWNISVHNWLKRYVYFRIYDDINDYKDNRKQINAKVITFMVSAFWHGFNPSYYIVFSHFCIGIIIEDNFEYIKKNIWTTKIGSVTLSLIYSIGYILLGNYLMGVLEDKHISKMFEFMSSVYLFPTIFCTVGYYVTSQIVLRHRKFVKLNKSH